MNEQVPQNLPIEQPVPQPVSQNIPAPRKEPFSVAQRVKSFGHAGRGVVMFLKGTHNSWIHIMLLVLAVALGIFFNITHTEWMMLVLASGFVLTAEAFNTAIEIDMDLTSPEYHPSARDTKDVAAGAVLIASLTAFVIGIEIFWHYFFPNTFNW